MRELNYKWSKKIPLAYDLLDCFPFQPVTLIFYKFQIISSELTASRNYSKYFQQISSCVVSVFHREEANEGITGNTIKLIIINSIPYQQKK